MKVLYVTKEFPYGLGEENVLSEIQDHLEYGWEIRIAPLSKLQRQRTDADNLFPLTYGEPLLSAKVLAGALLTFLRRPVRSLGALREIFGSRNLNLLVRNLAAYPKGLWLAGQVIKERFDHIHGHWLAVPATYATVAAYVSDTPFSITGHRYDIAQNNLLNWKARDADFIRCIDDMGCGEVAAVLGKDRRRPLVLHVGVKAAPETAPVRPGVLSTLRAAVGCRFVEKKGLNYLIDGVAAAKRRGVRVELDLFRDGPLEGALREQAQTLGIADQCRFRGAVEHPELLGGLRRGDFDCAALTSVIAADGDKEGVPAFLMEAASAGLPLVTTPNGGILELAGDGCGIICPERDSEAIGEAFVLLATDEAERRRLAAAARERMLAEFEIKTCNRRLRALITGDELPTPPSWLVADAPGPFAASRITRRPAPPKASAN